MPRTVKEWVGASDDTPAPKTVRARVFTRYGGRCYLSGRVIRAGDAWELEHVKPLWLGGENRETNLAPALRDAHAEKTAKEAGDRAKAARIHAKHFGYQPPSRAKIKSRGFEKTRPLAHGQGPHVAAQTNDGPPEAKESFPLNPLRNQ